MKYILFIPLFLQIYTFAGAQADTTNPGVKHQKEKPTPPWYVERFRLAAGFFVPINNTNIEVGSTDGTFGTVIDFEDDLGFKKTTNTFLADLQWRASPRSRFELSFYHINRKSSYTLQRDIEFGEDTYPVNADVKAFFNTDIYRFSYGYAFFCRPKFEAGLMIGVHVVPVNVGISINNGSDSLELNDDFKVTAPLPNLGIWSGFALSDRWALYDEISYFSLTVGNVKGRIISYRLSVQYRIHKNFSAAVEYTGFNFKVNAEQELLKGYFKWGYNGPALSVIYGFGKKSW